MPTALPARLLLDMPNWVGDQMMALPAVTRMVAANRRGVTVIHTRPPTHRLLHELYPDAVVVSSRRGSSPFVVAWRLLRNHGRFDLGVTFRNATRAKLLLRLVVRVAWGSPAQGASLLLDESFAVDRSRHQVHDADPVLLRLGLEPADPACRPFLRGELLAEGRRQLERVVTAEAPVVGLVPATASGTAKRWPGDRFAALACAARREGLQPLVLVGPGEERLAAEIQARAGWSLPVLGERLDVAGLAAVMAHLSLVVSIDSGPMHLAAAVGTPVLALFGPTDRARTGPLGGGHRVLRAELPCVPCRARSCRFGHTACMTELDAERVVELMLTMVGGASERRGDAAPQPWASDERRSVRLSRAT